MASSGGAAAGAVAAAQSARARRLIVGGLLVEVDETVFLRVAGETGLAVAEEIGFFRKSRVYFTVVGGITFYCKAGIDRRLPIAAIEARKIYKNGLSL